MSSAEALSALIASALPPAASISPASRFSFSSELKKVNATAAPSEASRLTIPSPIRREPPVTRATLPANDRPCFSVMSILQSGPNLSYWIILSRIRFRFLSVRRVQFHSLQINNEKRACVHEWSSSWLVAQTEAIRLGVTSVNSLLSHAPPFSTARTSLQESNNFPTFVAVVAIPRRQSVPELCLQILLGNFRIGGTERKIHAKRKHDSNRTTRRTRRLGIQVARTWTSWQTQRSQNGRWYNE